MINSGSSPVPSAPPLPQPPISKDLGEDLGQCKNHTSSLLAPLPCPRCFRNLSQGKLFEFNTICGVFSFEFLVEMQVDENNLLSGRRNKFDLEQWWWWWLVVEGGGGGSVPPPHSEN